MSLGDALGRVAAPAMGGPFEAIRLTMVDTLLAAQASTHLDQATWEAAFAQAVHAVTTELLDAADADLRTAAQHSRLSPQRLAAHLPTTAQRERLTQRLLASGIPLERLAHHPDDPAGQRLRAVALDSAWDDVLRLAAEEQQSWRRVAVEVREWRRPTTSLWVVTAASTGVTILVACWLGGILAAPSWFDPVARGFWRIVG